jgi:hypothetical protein
MQLRTLLRNGNPLFPLFSLASALFPSPYGVVPPSVILAPSLREKIPSHGNIGEGYARGRRAARTEAL